MIDLKKELLQLQDIYFHEEHMYCIMGTCYNDIDFDRDPETNCIRCGALYGIAIKICRYGVYLI